MMKVIIYKPCFGRVIGPMKLLVSVEGVIMF